SAATAQELGQLGLLPVATESAARSEIGSATVYKPKAHHQPRATADAAIAVRLPCLMTTSWFVHHVMVIVRDNAQRFAGGEWSTRLQRWVGPYVSALPTRSADEPPLVECKFEIGRDNSAAIYIRPRLEGEDINAALRIQFPLLGLDG